MKFSLKKGLAATLAVVMTSAAALPVFAAQTVTLSHGDGTVTATRTDGQANRIALAQFDAYGRLKGFNISSALNPTTVTNTYSFDPSYSTKVISFSNYETLTALEDYRTLGSKTLFVWDGDRCDIALDANGGSGGMDTDFTDGVGFGYEAASGGFRALGTKGRHIHMYPDSIATDWIVYDFDLTINADTSQKKDSNVQLLSVELYGGITTDHNGDGTHSEVYYPILIRSNDEGNWLSRKPQMQISYNNGQGGSTSSSYSQIGTGKHHYSLALNLRDRCYELRVDGTLITTNTLNNSGTYDMSNTSDADFPLRALRFHFKNNYDMTLDNMRVYEGSEPRDTISTETIREIILNGDSILNVGKYQTMFKDSLYTSQIGTTKAVHANTGVVWNGSQKVVLSNIPFADNGKQYVPKNELQSALGISCASDSNSVTRNGVVYVPIEDFLGSTAYTRLTNVKDNPNCYVLKSDFNPPDANKFNHWMLFYRPSEEQVLADYNASDRKGVHPRILATDSDFDRMRSWYKDYIKDDANFNSYYDSTETVKEDGTIDTSKAQWLGNEKANSPWNRWLRNSYSFVNGRVTAIEAEDPTNIPTKETVRTRNIPFYVAYDSVGRMMYQRMLASDMHILSLWYQLSGDAKYAEAAWKCIEQVLTFPDFNLGHKLDVSEAMAAMAIGYDWLYDYWVAYDKANGTNRLEQIETCIYNNGLFYAWNGYQENGLMAGEFRAEANHGTVGNNGAMMLAVAVMDVWPEECAYIISQAVKCQELNIWKWNTGAWFEGAGYWELTMQHTSKFIETLQGVFPGGYGFAGLEGLSEAGVAEVQHHTPLGIYNYGDSSMSKYWVPELIWLANEYDQTDLAYYVWKNREQGWNNDKSWHGEDSALALLWMLEQEDAKTYNWAAGYTPEKLGIDYCNEAIDVAIMRDTHDSTTDYTYVGVKGGCAVDNHAQIDAGSFIFEDNGIRWAQDPGSGSYIGGYFDTTSGGQRWKQLPARGEAHNTLIINPKTRGVAYEDQIIEERSELTGFTSNTNGAIATVDMTSVLFDVDKSVGATRGFFFTDNRQSLVVRDEFTPSNAGTAYWTMMLPAKSTITNDGNGRLTVTYNSQTLYVDYVVTGGTVGSIDTIGENFIPIDSTNIIDLVKTNGQIRIPVTITNGTAVGITVKLTPATATNTTPVSNYTSGIANWSL